MEAGDVHQCIQLTATMNRLSAGLLKCSHSPFCPGTQLTIYTVMNTPPSADLTISKTCTQNSLCNNTPASSCDSTAPLSRCAGGLGEGVNVGKGRERVAITKSGLRIN